MIKCLSKTDKHCFVIAHVKPRTNDKDPISKLPYYKLWIIFDKHDLHTSIYSANCSCKGGSDGYCRHVVATIFELMDFIDDSKKKSVTSGKCQCFRRSARNSAPTPIDNLEISLQEQEVAHPLPTENVYFFVGPFPPTKC